MFIETILKMKIEILDPCCFVKIFSKDRHFLNKNRPHLSKSNPFIFKIDSILRVFPDAKFVFLVRDPLETLPSYFSLQENVKFHNGSDFDASDVKFSIDRARDENSTNAQKGLFKGHKFS